MTPRAGAGPGPAEPLGAAEFGALMERLGPYETDPHIVAGVSGGADSMALAILLHRWTRSRGGRLTALTVDHGLRPEAAAEAARVGRILRSLGIAHGTLRRDGPVPAANLQAQARRMRLDLLENWCARRGVLHLALAHNLEDQAETLLLRLGRGSGLDGLAAMSPVGERSQVRVLRPLLDVPKDRLIAGLRRPAIAWIEDPTNRDRRHARVRLRALAPALAAEGLGAERLAATAKHLGRARQALNQALAQLLVNAVRLHPAGFATLDPEAVAGASDELALRGLSRLLMTVGGLAYAPRLERLERLLAALRGGLNRGVTLGGCRILPGAGNARDGETLRMLVVRETRGIGTAALNPGTASRWDGRFEIVVSAQGKARNLTVAALGHEGWALLRAARGAAGAPAIPAAARPTLAAVWDAKGLLAVPYLDYRRPGSEGSLVLKCRFAPKNGLTAGAFTVA